MFSIHGWSDIANIVTILSAPLILISVYAGFRQIKAQADISLKDLTFHGLLSNSTNYQKISDYRQSLIERHELMDKTITYRTAYMYYTKYWLHASQQWDFFESGLIPYRTFLGWTLYAYGLIAGEHNVHYFDREGNEQILNSRYVFTEKFIGSVYKNHVDFYNFYIGLYSLDAEKYENRIIAEEHRMKAISKYLKDYMKSRKIKSL